MQRTIIFALANVFCRVSMPPKGGIRTLPFGGVVKENVCNV
jgi:hypothetical protein